MSILSNNIPIEFHHRPLLKEEEHFTNYVGKYRRFLNGEFQAEEKRQFFNRECFLICLNNWNKVGIIQTKVGAKLHWTYEEVI